MGGAPAAATSGCRPPERRPDRRGGGSGPSPFAAEPLTRRPVWASVRPLVMSSERSQPEIVLANAVTGVVFRIRRTAADTGGELLEMEAAYPPSSAVPPPHLHPRQHERFRILEGAMHASVAGRLRVLRAGDTVEIPAGTVHAMWNAGAVPARVNWQTRPALRTQEFFAAAFALAARGRVDARGTPRLLDLAILVPRYWQEIRITRPSPLLQRILFAVLRPVALLLGRGSAVEPVPSPGPRTPASSSGTQPAA